jgi:hypothetical protein
MAGQDKCTRQTMRLMNPGVCKRNRPSKITSAATTLLWLTVTSAQAAPPGAGNAASATIYSCIDSAGHRLSSDRPIPECLNQDQKILGRDGSTRRVVPPYVSREEQDRLDAQRRAQEKKLAAQKELERQDRALLARYPNSASHDAARQSALQPLKEQMQATNQRLAQLDTERNALASERAGYGFKAVPDELKYRSNINEGSIEAQRNILRHQELDFDRMNQQFDAERSRLLKLWAGAAPGSFGGGVTGTALAAP